jgi:hypothetical protein
MSTPSFEGATFPREGMYKMELLRGRVLWPEATMQQNFTFYLQNKHPLVALFASHPKHPLDRQERYWILLSDFFLRVWISLAFVLHTAALEAGQGIEEVEATRMSPFAASVIVALVTNVVHTVLETVAVLDDKCCAGRRDTCLYQCTSRATKYALKGIFGLNAMVAVVLGSIASTLLGIDPVVFAQTLFISMVNSWTWTWLAIASVMFALSAWSDKKFDEKLAKTDGVRLTISWEELHRWARMDIENPNIPVAANVDAKIDPSQVNPVHASL